MKSGLQYQCDFCFDIVEPKFIPKEFGYYVILGLHIVRDTVANGEFHICSKCLKKKFNTEFKDGYFQETEKK